MNLQDKINEDLKDAMKARQQDRVGVLRMLKAAIKNTAIEKGTETLSDEEVLPVLRKEVKKRYDSVECFEKGGRLELAAKERCELEVLGEYLPKALSPAEVTQLVQAAIAEAGATSKAQMGAVMKIANAKAAGRVDGKTLSAEVQKHLS